LIVVVRRVEMLSVHVVPPKNTYYIAIYHDISPL